MQRMYLDHVTGGFRILLDLDFATIKGKIIDPQKPTDI